MTNKNEEKVNVEPKKFYLLPNGMVSYCRNTDEDIEYTHTDTLIDKACEWLKDNIDDYFTASEGEFEEWFDEMIGDFKQAMKGDEE